MPQFAFSHETRPYDYNLPVPKPPEKCSLDETDKDAAMHQPGRGSDNYPDYALCMSNELHLIIQSE